MLYKILFLIFLLPIHFAVAVRANKIRADPTKLVVASEGQGRWAQETVNSMLRIAHPDRDIEWSNEYRDPDLIVRSFCFREEPRFRTNSRAPYLVFSGEPFVPDDRLGYPPLFRVITTVPTSDIDLYLPQAVGARYELPHLRRFPQRKGERRPYLVAYVNSHTITEREELFRLLRERDPLNAHALGKCSNTHEMVPGGWRGDALIETYSNYRFVFAMENCCKSHYVTEKIMNAFVSGAIPIYWGDSNAARRFFNPDSYVDINDFDNLEVAADFIIALDNDPERYHQMASASIFADNEPDELFSVPEKFPESWQPHIQRLRIALQPSTL